MDCHSQCDDDCSVASHRRFTGTSTDIVSKAFVPVRFEFNFRAIGRKTLMMARIKANIS